VDYSGEVGHYIAPCAQAFLLFGQTPESLPQLPFDLSEKPIPVPLPDAQDEILTFLPAVTKTPILFHD